ncbi:MAG: IPT/TIG domain-containing protein [Patescibacteria group bacterium]
MKRHISKLISLASGALLGIAMFFVVTGGAVAQQEGATLTVIPQTGGPGQYVLVIGADFGTQAGSTTFVRSGQSIDANTAFPDACENLKWRPSGIIVKVPSQASQGQHVLKVRGKDGSEIGQQNFTVTQAVPSPGICGILPDNGPAENPITIYGEGFGDTQGKVTFNTATAEVAENGWSNTAIRLKNAPSFSGSQATIRAITSSGTLSSPARFTQSSQCSQGQCGEGQSCCTDGSCRPSGACEVVRAQCTYSWSFYTGRLGGIGAACTASAQCQSGVCTDGKCAAGNVKAGETCSYDSQCADGLCVNNVCAAVKKSIGE